MDGQGQDGRDLVGDGRVTIYDVAQEVGVSPSTVSRAFSRPGRVSSETSRRIHEAAERLGYRSERPHRIQAPTRSRVVALAVSDITNPFYFGIIRGAEKAAADNDFSLLVADARESAEEERRMLARHLPLVDGLMVTSSRLSDTEIRGLARKVPVVVLNRRVHGLPCVLADTPRGSVVRWSTSPPWATRGSATWPVRRRRGPTEHDGVPSGRRAWSSWSPTCGSGQWCRRWPAVAAQRWTS